MKNIDRLYKVGKGIVKNILVRPREIKAALRRIDAGVDSMADEVDRLETQIEEARIKVATGQDMFKQLVELRAEKKTAEEALALAQEEQKWFEANESEETKKLYAAAKKDEEE